MPESTTEAEEIPEESVTETKEISQVTIETTTQYPIETHISEQVTELRPEKQVTLIERDFSDDATTRVEETVQIVGIPRDVAETTFEVPLQTGVPEEMKPEDEEPTIHTTEFTMDVAGQAKTEFPEMTLVIEQDGQLTVETTKTEEETPIEELSLVKEIPVITEQIVHAEPTESMVQEQPVEQVPEQPIEITPVEDQESTVSETTFDVAKADQAVPDMMAVLEQKLHEFKVEMITSQQEVISQQADQKIEVFFDAEQVDVPQKPQESLVSEEIVQQPSEEVTDEKQIPEEVPQITETEFVMTKPETETQEPEVTQITEQEATVQSEFVTTEDEEVKDYSPDVTQAEVEVETGRSAFPEMMMVLEQKMDTFKTEIVTAQPDSIIEQDFKVTEISMDMETAQTAVAEPTRVGDLVTEDLETVEKLEGVPEEKTEVSEILVDMSKAEQTYPKMTFVLEPKEDDKPSQITIEKEEHPSPEVSFDVSTVDVQVESEYQRVEQEVIEETKEVPEEKTAQEEDVTFEAEFVIDTQMADIEEKKETQTKEVVFDVAEAPAMIPEEVSTQPVEVVLDISKPQETETETEAPESPLVKGTAAIHDQIPAQDVSVIFFDAVEDQDLDKAERADQEAQAPETVSRISPEATEETPVPLDVVEIAETETKPETELLEVTETFVSEQLTPETVERISPDVTEETPAVLEMEAAESHVTVESQEIETIETVKTVTEEPTTEETTMELQVEPAAVTEVQVEQEYEEESSSEKVVLTGNSD